MFVRQHFEDGQYLCSWASQTPITTYVLKAYDEIIGEHKYKDKDNDKDSDKDKVPENPTYAIFLKS